MTGSPEIKKNSPSARSVILSSGLLMSILCVLLVFLTHGFHPTVLKILNVLTGQLIEHQITLLGNGFHYEVANNQMPITAFLIVYAGLCLLSVIPLHRLKRKEITSDLGKKNENSGFLVGLKTPMGLILLFALIFRILLLFSVPVHESDFYRYLWDGKVATEGINPYLHEPGMVAPADQVIVNSVSGMVWSGRESGKLKSPILNKLKKIRHESSVTHERVSHQWVATVYPPVAQMVFSLSSLLFGDSLIGLKAILLLFDSLVIVVTIGILRRLKLNPAWVIIYAWSPLVLKEFANSAHYDSVPLFFTLLAIYSALGFKRQFSVAIALALGTLAKFYSVILLPVLIPLRPNQWRSYLLYACIISIAYLPFFWWNGAGVQKVFAGLGVYNQHWQYNAGIFALIQQTVAFITPVSQSNLMPAKIIVALVLLIVIFRQSFCPSISSDNKQDLVRRCFIVIAALFVLSPTAFPWYFTWVMPFLCVFPNRAWIMLSWLLPLSYIDFHSDIAISRALFINIPAINWIIWGTFALLLIADYFNILNSKRVSPSPDS